MSRAGADLALLLLMSFQRLASEATAELARRGHPDFRAVHAAALRAVAAGAVNAAEVGRRLSISKQAAAKTIAVLEKRGYVTRVDHPVDKRAYLVRVSRRGARVLWEGEAIFNDLRDEWIDVVGKKEVARVETALKALVRSPPTEENAAGALARNSD
jgi:DNA-binding MarR family transcriptional regulator